MADWFIIESPFGFIGYSVMSDGRIACHPTFGADTFTPIRDGGGVYKTLGGYPVQHRDELPDAHPDSYANHPELEKGFVRDSATLTINGKTYRHSFEVIGEDDRQAMNRADTMSPVAAYCRLDSNWSPYGDSFTVSAQTRLIEWFNQPVLEPASKYVPNAAPQDTVTVTRYQALATPLRRAMSRLQSALSTEGYALKDRDEAQAKLDMARDEVYAAQSNVNILGLAELANKMSEGK